MEKHAGKEVEGKRRVNEGAEVAPPSQFEASLLEFICGKIKRYTLSDSWTVHTQQKQ